MAYLTDDELLDTEDDFTEWDEDTAAGSTEETLEQALAEERPLIMIPSWRPRKKKPPRLAKSD